MSTESNHHVKPDKTQHATAIRLIPFIVGCALFMQMLDSSVVAMALPMMADTFNTTAVRMNIAITAYLIAVAIFVPVCGWAADHFGAKRIFLLAILLFCLTSLGCSMAPTFETFIFFRFMQGIAGAMMVPVGRIIMLKTVPREQLLKATAFLSIPALLGPMLGPPLGGFIVTVTSWHWIFLINIPMGMLGIFMVLKYIQEYRTENPPRLDWPGFILSGIAMASCVYGFESLAKNQGFINAYFLLAISFVSGILYWFHAKRVANPIIDLSLLKIQSFAISIIAGNLCRFAIGSTPFLLALLLQIGFNYSPLSAGLITFAGALGALAMKFVAIPILKNFGFRRVLTVNAVITGLFIMACALFTLETPVWLMTMTLLFGGFFRSLEFTSVNTLSFANIKPEKMSQASSFSATAQQVGISMGMGIATLSIDLSMRLNGSPTPSIQDIKSGFIVIGAASILSALWFYRLEKSAGSGMY
ncbi:MAG: DHA2 family efflux MFS transporter permease subunit [Advenella sp.]|uniref:DHA2 family efflux MFS transporter permease subunit n=1 Tax=Advenella sp. TaxID=1872388 RepID=UPI0025897685|nr:DHA2 family efflux MFS transporter permease subunit [Advenella sp.]MDD3758966.1 DHA2 family efflux MFS transporter permease subunit [Advenella sp.]